MKQKIVIEVPINDQKSRKKALKIAVGQSGVISAALQGQDKNKIEVIGEGVDPVALTTMLRKKVGFAELQNVSAVGDKKDDDKKKTSEEKNEAMVKHMVWPYYDGVPLYQIYEVPNPSHEPSCTIM